MDTTGIPFHLRLVVTPSAGRVRFYPPRRFAAGSERVDAGQALARLEQGQHQTVVRAPVGGTVCSVLAIEGEPMAANQPLFAIEPEER
ncbi:MAG TPA: biotin/lipoyl-containing protein [Actinomycetota bacterium]|jgi:biotin carboxyl carrier protein